MNKQYVAIVQCDIVKQRCSGYHCEKAFYHRTGGFSVHSEEPPLRSLYLTCGGCNGRAVQRKLANLIRKIGKSEGVDKSAIAVHLSSCITLDNHHGVRCPHIDDMKTLIARLGLDVFEDTYLAERSESLRVEGRYAPRQSKYDACPS